MATWLIRRCPTGETVIEVRHTLRGKAYPTSIRFPPKTRLKVVVAGVLAAQKLDCTRDIIVVPGGGQLWPPRLRRHIGGGEGTGIPTGALRVVRVG